MFNKLIILILCLFTYAEMVNAQLSKPILKEIAKLQNNKKNDFGISKRFNDTHKLLNESDSLYFINQKVDTVYLLEMYDIETGISYGSIWNKCKTLNYTYNYGDTIEFNLDNLFTKHTKKLVSAWDIDEIRKEERENPGFISRSTICAIRINIGEKNKIDMVSFAEFFNFERDAYDQYDLSN